MTHGLTGRWSYLTQTVSDISDLLQPLEDAIRHHLIQAITGRAGITGMERDLLALPTRLRGMGIPNPTETCNEKFMSSEHISAALAALILQQEKVHPSSAASEQTSIKNNIKAQQQRAQANEAARLREAPGHGIWSRKDASHCLLVIPLTEYGFTLHKGTFKDAINLQY